MKVKKFSKSMRLLAVLWMAYTPWRSDALPPPWPPNLQSTTHRENTLSQNNNPFFSWGEPFDESGIAGYSYQLDHHPNSVPDKLPEGNGDHQAISYVGLPNGSWYFHVRAADGNGNWGDLAHYGPIIIQRTEIIELENVVHVPTQIGSIGAAVDRVRAFGGGAVVVHAGTYTGSVTLQPGVMLIGAGADVTTIEAPGGDAVIAQDNSLIAGFTIANSGIGINGKDHPRLTNFRVMNNRLVNNGSGVFLVGASPMIIGNEFIGNTIGIDCRQNSNPLISNNRILSTAVRASHVTQGLLPLWLTT